MHTDSKEFNAFLKKNTARKCAQRKDIKGSSKEIFVLQHYLLQRRVTLVIRKISRDDRRGKSGIVFVTGSFSKRNNSHKY